MQQPPKFKTTPLYSLLIAICHTNAIAPPSESDLLTFKKQVPHKGFHDLACELTLWSIVKALMAQGKQVALSIDLTALKLVLNDVEIINSPHFDKEIAKVEAVTKYIAIRLTDIEADFRFQELKDFGWLVLQDGLLSDGVIGTYLYIGDKTKALEMFNKAQETLKSNLSV